ncbi:uncharacterized protein LOC126831547 isoform X2 [Patella vulgata]|uniref:uncharacterized protein LOC126831547 isoform X2 n=1 Tax=Patella vulgata TaxID=6465 RepID=UPI00217FA1BB|nr:uncharacterized protein LOC126831547 isoform X2 [Patella vulgata]
MANLKAVVGFCVCIFVLLAILEIQLAESGRGFRGGRYRASRYRASRSYRSPSRVRNSVRVRNRVRVRSGSSPFSRTTFKAALIGGSIYGASRYMRTSRYRRDPYAMPTVCTNNYDSDGNGTVYGYFICPRNGEPESYTYCCGNSLRERCCAYFSEHGDDKGRTAGIVVGVIILIIVISIIVYCVCKRSGTSGKIVRKFSSKNSNKEQYAAVHKDPGPVDMVHVPTQPGQQYPDNYGPAPPYSQQPGSPAPSYPAPYDQPGYPTSEKGPLPDGDVNQGGQPYPPQPGMNPYPPQGNMPYPPQGNMPYPPQGNMPYPTQGNMPYPPQGNMPYPPPGQGGPPPPQGYGGAAYPPVDPPPYPAM